ncbi:WD40-repeat-containing domain protein [Morchella snyderi]|nr:WD40-repeat-containing domain protein [Morchella snyderi]
MTKKSRKPATAVRERPPKDDRTPLPKNDAELELEKLVFGDLSGFQQNLRENAGALEKYYSSDDDEGEHVVEGGAEEGGPGEDLAALADDELFFTDAGLVPGAGTIAARGENEEGAEAVEVDAEGGEATAAWVDSDDERLTISLASVNQRRKLRETEADDFVNGHEYSRRLRRQFERIYPIPDWARPPSPEHKRRRRDSSSSSSGSDMEIDDQNTALTAPPLSDFLQSTHNWTRPAASGKLKPEILNIARLTDANHSGGSQSGVNALHFHPSHPLVLSSGFDSTLRLHHIDGKVNPPATSLHIRRTPINSAWFHPDGKRVFASGRRRYFHVWDLESGAVEKVTRVYGHQEEQKSMERFKLSPDGRFMAILGSKGRVNILDAKTLQWVALAAVEGRIQDVSWHHDGSTLTIANKGGELWEYDITARAFTARWRDEGGFATTVVANGGSRWVAVGSQSGIVNIYDRKLSFGGNAVGAVGTPEEPKPMRAMEQLVTAISVLEFSPDAQVLCMASRGKKDALRMIHLPSCTVYKNWPTSKTPLGKVTTVAFAGKETGMVAIGNEAGNVRLFEIKP